MADPVDWPATLPQCAQQWAERANPDIVRTSMEVGPPKERRRSTLVNKEVEVQWTIKASVYELLNFFYETTLQMGIIPFYYRHPITGVMNIYRMIEPPQQLFIAGRVGVGAVQVATRFRLET